jgi:hypothetical protein
MLPGLKCPVFGVSNITGAKAKAKAKTKTKTRAKAKCGGSSTAPLTMRL